MTGCGKPSRESHQGAVVESKRKDSSIYLRSSLSYYLRNEKGPAKSRARQRQQPVPALGAAGASAVGGTDVAEAL